MSNLFRSLLFSINGFWFLMADFLALLFFESNFSIKDVGLISIAEICFTSCLYLIVCISDLDKIVQWPREYSFLRCAYIRVIKISL